MERVDTSIDDCHCDLIYGLVRAFKPMRILEFGYGTGKSQAAILRGMPRGADYLCVDDWSDFYGVPQLTRGKTVTFDEGKYVEFCIKNGFTYDFILCDGDHTSTHKYYYDLTHHVLQYPGVIIFHDVCNQDFPNLSKIVDESRRSSFKMVLFDKNSEAGERCDRGLLVLFRL